MRTQRDAPHGDVQALEQARTARLLRLADLRPGARLERQARLSRQLSRLRADARRSRTGR